MNKNIAYIILALLLTSCTYNFKIKTNPEDASIFVNDKLITQNEIITSDNKEIKIKINRYGFKDLDKSYYKLFKFGTKYISIDLTPESYDVVINTVEPDCDLFIDSKRIGKSPVKLKLIRGEYNLKILKNGYTEENALLNVKKNGTYLFRQHKGKMIVRQMGIIECDRLPKQVIFSPDDKYIFIVLLEGKGYQIFDIDKMKITDYITAPDKSNKSGYPEGLFIKDKKVFWVSQMNTGLLYEFSYPDNKWLRTISSEGVWPKFLAWSGILNVLAVSNWDSNDVSIIDYNSGKVIHKIKTAPAPRGLAFSSDSKYLYVASYDGGVIYKINTNGWKTEKTICKRSCMRHAVLTKDDRTLYVSDMLNSLVYEIDTDTFVITRMYKVGEETNTISLTPDEKYLFASCRGPNDKVSYLNRSPENGDIVIIDLKKKEVISSFKAGNQPTALGISNSGKYLCTSNFRDNNIELFAIGDLK